MRGIADCNQESPFGDDSPFDGYRIRFRLIFQKLQEHVLHVGYSPTPLGFRKFLTHGGIKPDARRAIERMAVDNAPVASYGVAASDDLQRFPYVLRDAEGAGEAVARAQRDDAEGSGGVRKHRGDLIDRPVAPGGNDYVSPLPYGLRGKLHGMPRTFGVGHAHADAAVGETLRDTFPETLFRPRP